MLIKFDFSSNTGILVVKFAFATANLKIETLRMRRRFARVFAVPLFSSFVLSCATGLPIYYKSREKSSVYQNTKPCCFEWGNFMFKTPYLLGVRFWLAKLQSIRRQGRKLNLKRFKKIANWELNNDRKMKISYTPLSAYVPRNERKIRVPSRSRTRVRPDTVLASRTWYPLHNQRNRPSWIRGNL